MTGQIVQIRNGRRILTPAEAEERGALLVPPGALPPGVRKIKGRDLAKTLPREQVHERTRSCSECSTAFVETIITPAGQAPRPRDPDERPDLCNICFKRLNRFPIIGARKPRGTDVTRRI